MNNREKAAWLSFVAIMQNFLGTIKVDNYPVFVAATLLAFRDFGCNVSIKLHFFSEHPDEFPNNLGAVNDKQGKRFHQDLKTMEHRYQGRWDKVMMAIYCWSITQDCPEEVYKRKFFHG